MRKRIINIRRPTVTVLKTRQNIHLAGLVALGICLSLTLLIIGIVFQTNQNNTTPPDTTSASIAATPIVSSNEVSSSTPNVSRLNRIAGVYENPITGLRETWYSEEVLPGGGLNIPGRYVDDKGIIRDENDYIVCASSDFEEGTIVQTSLGSAKVYDSGCESGTLDIYTDWIPED